MIDWSQSATGWADLSSQESRLTSCSFGETFHFVPVYSDAYWANQVIAFLPSDPTEIFVVSRVLAHDMGSLGTVAAPRSASGQRQLQSAVDLSPQGSVKYIYEASGLTWDQLARAFGVSKRAILQWASGAKLSARNLEQVHRFRVMVDEVDGPSPESRRDALLAGGEASVLNRWVNSNSRPRGINAPSTRPEDLL